MQTFESLRGKRRENYYLHGANTWSIKEEHSWVTFDWLPQGMANDTWGDRKVAQEEMGLWLQIDVSLV